MNIPEELRDVLDFNPEIISGAIRFKGTRVPVQALLETLEDGDTVADFLSGYPGVSAEQVEAVIRWQQHEARRTFGLELAA
jgi:uncharacterized protein (DUF433 family)